MSLGYRLPRIALARFACVRPLQLAAGFLALLARVSPPRPFSLAQLLSTSPLPALIFKLAVVAQKFPPSASLLSLPAELAAAAQENLSFLLRFPSRESLAREIVHKLCHD